VESEMITQAARIKPTAGLAGAYEALPTDAVSPLFEMVLEATEEAVYNSLLRATPNPIAVGRRRSHPNRPVERNPWQVRCGKETVNGGFGLNYDSCRATAQASAHTFAAGK
jgi:hypothetical protein